MRVLFLHPPWPGGGFGGRSQNRWPRKRGDKAARYPAYLCYVATLMKKNGFEVSYIDSVMQEFSEEEALEKVKSICPEVIYTETSTPTINYDISFAEKAIKLLPSATYIFSGSHATYFPKEVLQQSPASIAIMGEQDYSALEAVQALRDKRPLLDIKGICWKDEKGNIHINPPRELIRNLDELPFPDRSLIPHQWYIEGHAAKKPFTFVMASRGCPNKCTFCLWTKVFFNRQVRVRSIENVIAELKWLVDEYHMKEIFFDDATFNVNKKRVIDICERMVSDKINLSWGCSCRVDKVDEEMLSHMKRSGCRIICYGPESASEETLQKTNKKIDISQAYRAIQLTKKAGIIAHANFMVGFPWETKEDMQRTIDFAQRLNPDTMQISLVFPHPGSEMYDQAIENNWFEDDIVGNWDRFEMSLGPVLKSGSSKEDLQSAISKGHAKFFFRPSYIMKTIGRIRSIGELLRVIRGAHSVIKGKILYNRPVKWEKKP